MWRRALGNRYVVVFGLIAAVAAAWSLYVARHDQGLVQGRVVGPDGRPVVAATVTLFERTLTTLEPRATVHTGPDGHRSAPRDALTRRKLFLHTLIRVILGEQTSAQRAVLDTALTATYTAAGITDDPATWTQPVYWVPGLAEVSETRVTLASTVIRKPNAPVPICRSTVKLVALASPAVHARSTWRAPAKETFADILSARASSIVIEANGDNGPGPGIA